MELTLKRDDLARLMYLVSLSPFAFTAEEIASVTGVGFFALEPASSVGARVGEYLVVGTGKSAMWYLADEKNGWYCMVAAVPHTSAHVDDLVSELQALAALR